MSQALAALQLCLHEAFMAFRLPCYMTRIWNAFLLARPEAERGAAIISMVLKHSERGWNRVTQFEAWLEERFASHS
jgi:hypothetical protein